MFCRVRNGVHFGFRRAWSACREGLQQQGYETVCFGCVHNFLCTQCMGSLVVAPVTSNRLLRRCSPNGKTPQCNENHTELLWGQFDLNCCWERNSVFPWIRRTTSKRS
eukprot:PhF_6_TR25287/c0_g1_i2/m.34876